jgi:cell division initiation protein
MRITPLDIIQKQFAPGRRGYDADEVRVFLEEVRESMEELLKENQRLRAGLAEREAQIDELRSNESDVKATLMLARKVSDDLERTARREADVVVGEARLEAERILMATADERRDIQAELVHIRATRVRLLADLRAVVDSHKMLLEDYERAADRAPLAAKA